MGCASVKKVHSSWINQGYRSATILVTDKYIYIYHQNTTTTQCKLPECKAGICASGWKEKHHRRKLQWVKPLRVQGSLCANVWGRHTTTVSCCWWLPPQAQGTKVRVQSAKVRTSISASPPPTSSHLQLGISLKSKTTITNYLKGLRSFTVPVLNVPK